MSELEIFVLIMREHVPEIYTDGKKNYTATGSTRSIKSHHIRACTDSEYIQYINTFNVQY